MLKLRSPKNKFRIEFNYSKPLKHVGSCCSITTNDVEKSSNFIDHYVQMARQNNVSLTVTVRENKKVYPEFDWQKINQYTVNCNNHKNIGKGNWLKVS
jgi:hypothetical protein